MQDVKTGLSIGDHLYKMMRFHLAIEITLSEISSIDLAFEISIIRYQDLILHSRMAMQDVKTGLSIGDNLYKMMRFNLAIEIT